MFSFRDTTELPTLHFRCIDCNKLEQMFRVIQHHKVGNKEVGIYRKWKIVMADGLAIKH